jgi:biotin carboxyl carrier protein
MAVMIDPRAVRVSMSPGSARTGIEPVVVEPARIQGGGIVLVDGLPVELHLQRVDAVRGILVEGRDDGPRRIMLAFLPTERPDGSGSGVVRREIVVDGWRVEVEIEPEHRALLRARTRRGPEENSRGGPLDVRAFIPGRVVFVSVVPGDRVEAGQQLLVVEAMKMQNELRAPRDGVVSRVGVGVGQTVEVGDLLLELE